MGAKSEALAKQFEVKARDAVASTLEPISNMIKAVAAGQSVDSFRLDELDEMNARHAKDYADCARPETIELLERNAAVAVATVRALNDGQLAKSATLFTGAPPMTAEQIITSGLLAHIDDHFGSIRKTVGWAGKEASA